MNKKTKKSQQNNIDYNKQYNVNEAIFLLKKIATAKFIESIDTAINLGIDVRNSNQNVRGSAILPHGIGRNIRVAVCVKDNDIEKAKNSGADLVGSDDLIVQIKQGKLNFDIFIASPDTMHIVNKISKILGPRGLMPNPKIGTVTSNIEEAVQRAKIGQICYRNDNSGIIHSIIGKVNFTENQIEENLKTLLISIKKNKPIQTKGIYIKKVSISATMSKSILINYNVF